MQTGRFRGYADGKPTELLLNAGAQVRANLDSIDDEKRFMIGQNGPGEALG